MNRDFTEELMQLINDHRKNDCLLNQLYKIKGCVTSDDEDKACKNCKYEKTHVEIDINDENTIKTIKMSICDLFNNLYFLYF